MKTSREQIMMTALRLFAERGYDAVSTGMLAEELGITKGALYRHFAGKREIYDSIIRRMFELDAQRAAEDHVPEKEFSEDAESYAQTELTDLCTFVCNQFDFWTGDEFASLFRRMITIDQFKTPESGKLYQDVIALGPVRYTEDLMGEMLRLGRLNEQAAAFGARNLAVQLFAPLQLMIQLADGGCDRTELRLQLAEITKEFTARWQTEKKKKTTIDEKKENAMEMNEKKTNDTNTDQMKTPDMSRLVIRREQPEDHRAVEELVRESFWNVYRPGCTEHFVLKKLRDDEAFVHELDFVMEKDGCIIGQNIFVRTVIHCDDGNDFPILTMGPICIAPDLKRQGYGKVLLDFSFAEAARLGYTAACFEGNIDFYGKSGCILAGTKGVRYPGIPDGEIPGFFLCRELQEGALDGISGVYETPKGYFSAEEDPAAFEEYDAGFPRREKLKLPGQLF